MPGHTLGICLRQDSDIWADLSLTRLGFWLNLEAWLRHAFLWANSWGLTKACFVLQNSLGIPHAYAQSMPRQTGYATVMVILQSGSKICSKPLHQSLLCCTSLRGTVALNHNSHLLFRNIRWPSKVSHVGLNIFEIMTKYKLRKFNFMRNGMVGEVLLATQPATDQHRQ